jgi:signal transduction histidine kinase
MAAVHPDDRLRVEQRYEEGIRSGQAFAMELRFRAGDGQYRWFLSRATPLRNADGAVTKFLGTATDIEDIKRAQVLALNHTDELERAVAERTLELSETIGELEGLSYGVAHDMRAPLRAMRGYAELLLEGDLGALEPAARGYLERIAAAAARLDSLIDDVLTYTRVLRSGMKLEPVDVERTLREVISNYPDLKSHADAIGIAGPLPRLLGHEASLTQCFANLLTNAVKFVSPGIAPRVRVHAEDRGTDARIWIEDNGIGIAPRDQERIFNIFERISGPNAYGGTGVGLAVVRKAVTRLHGQVGVESTPGEGSRFWLQLPKVTFP